VIRASGGVRVALGERYFLCCLLGMVLATTGLSASELQPWSYTFFPGPQAFFSLTQQVVWAPVGILVFAVAEVCFFAPLVLLLRKGSISESWIAYMVKTTVFLAACVTLMQRTGGYAAWSTALINGSLYVDNCYTEPVQSVALASIYASLLIVLTGDFLLRGKTAKKPSERVYQVSGAITIIFGLIMILLAVLTIPSYSLYAIPGVGYFYTQLASLSTVDAFEIVGVFVAILGCVVICFQRDPPPIKEYYVVSGSALTLLALPLAFVPVQVWIDRNVFYSSLLAPLDIGRLHGIFPLNFNLFTFIALILFTAGVFIHVQNSRIKTLTLIAFLLYIYFYPGLYRYVLSGIHIQSPTPTVPLPVYAGLAIVAAVVSTPLDTGKPGWNISSLIRRVLKPSTKTTLAALLLLAVLIPILMLSSAGGVTSTPLTQAIVKSQGLSVEDRIDPRLLSLNIGSSQNVSVILRFDAPIPQDDIDRLNTSPDYDFFTIERYNGDPAVYQEKAYYAVHGNISVDNSSDLRQKLVRLVNDFHLSYVLLNQNPAPPSIDAHYAQYYFVGADILRAWNITGKWTTIAIVDSGVNDYAEGIAGKKNGRVIYQVNFLTGQEGDPRLVGELTPEGLQKHGTLVALEVAGVKGVAPDANIIDLKIKRGSEESFYMTCVYMAEALDWCVRNKDRFNISVVELALGNRDQIYGFLTEAVDRAFLSGIVVIVAGGGYLDITKNHFMGLLTPGIADWGITVAATMGIEDESWSPISPLGPSPHWYLPKPELTGPGMYTSGSVPMVSGISLLLTQQYNEMGLPPLLRAASIRWALIAGAQEYDLGPPGWDIMYGFGRANALTSFLLLKNHFQI